MKFNTNDIERCSMCDEWYDSTDKESSKIHKHPEPQRGFPRNHLMEYCKIGHTYEDWIKDTGVGQDWAFNNN